jgi:hypothetical protein
VRRHPPIDERIVAAICIDRRRSHIMATTRSGSSGSTSTRGSGSDMQSGMGQTGGSQAGMGQGSGLQAGMGQRSGQRTPDSTYDLISVMYHALQGCEAYEQYANDAEQAGRQDLAQFFREALQENERRAQRGQQLLAECLQQGPGARSGQQLQSGTSGGTSQQGSGRGQGQQGSSGSL